ncbi:ImmA/IrrE family metallo-endopeptidase [Nocardia cyriacigeorgica]|uniref:ImmA/IrrE family metallo-endopeptidase n=1 Tax=Nocardia cyriacigeorgica TaxID=135487 RepID=UPI0024579404|nr:ImmA/IrrE family metallo-endopeptidase [Nocardia cyriacigeorgica]
MVSFRVPVEPALLEWAVERSGIDPVELSSRREFQDLPLWETRVKSPTYRQLQKFAAATYTPLGLLFLPEPPDEEVPIPDFRTIRNEEIARPSPNLLDTIFLCEQRQEWYREYARAQGFDPLPFVGSASVDMPITDIAGEIRRELQFSLEERSQSGTWDKAFRRLIDTAEDAGILVMVSGIVGNNTHRPLDFREFRGFALSDVLAPLVFVNGTDTKAAQIFTLIHEIVHIWLGQSALTDSALDQKTNSEIEIWCNKVAAEVLVPISLLRRNYKGSPEQDELDRLAKLFKSSTLVVLRRIFDAGYLEWSDFRRRYHTELSRVLHLASARSAGPGGGNFYYTQPLRVSRRFASAIISDTLSGRTLHRDAYRLLGTRKHETFVQLGEQVGAA